MVLSVSNTVKPLWQNSKATRPKDDLFAAIDDYSRELYAFRPMQNHRHGQTVNQAKKQPALPFSKCRLLFDIFNGHAPGFVGLKEWVWRRYAMATARLRLMQNFLFSVRCGHLPTIYASASATRSFKPQ